MKPFFSYYGGKQRMAKKIIRLIPKHMVYVEPFSGGASVLFLKPFPKVTNGDCYREVINDTNKLVYNFYNQLRWNPRKLKRLINCTAYCEQTHSESVCICQGKKIVDDLTRAWAFFVNINMSFGNIFNAGWGRGLFRTNLSYSWYSKINNLNRYLSRMQGVHISCVDALTCIRQWDSPQTFFYIDPPYVDTNQGDYSGYTQKHLDKLIRLLKKIDGSFILSGYENNSYPDTWERFEFKSYCSASVKGKANKNRNKSVKASSKDLGNRDRTEIVLRHITKKPVRPEIEEIYKMQENKQGGRMKEYIFGKH